MVLEEQKDIFSQKTDVKDDESVNAPEVTKPSVFFWIQDPSLRTVGVSEHCSIYLEKVVTGKKWDSYTS